MINGKNKRVSNTPINYDHKIKRVSQPIGFGKKSSAIDGLEQQQKVRKSTVLMCQNKAELLNKINDIRSPS